MQEEYQDKPEPEAQSQPQETQPEACANLTSLSEPAPAPTPAAACGDNETLLIELSKQLEESTLIEAPLLEPPLLLDNSNSNSITGGNSNNKFWARMFNQQQTPLPTATGAAAPTSIKANNNNKPSQASNQSCTGSSNSNNAWLELFADLDPLANPQAFDLKMSGGRRVAEQT